MGSLHPPILHSTHCSRHKITRNHQQSPCQRDQDSPSRSSSPQSSRNCSAQMRTKCRGRRVKALWAHIKENKLQDSDNKQYFTPDTAMEPIFGTEKIRAFGMAKFLKGHLG